MSYSLATFYVDPINGDDSPRSLGSTITGWSNPVGSIVRGTTAGAHNLYPGVILQLFWIGDPTHYANGYWIVSSVPTPTTFELEGADANDFLPAPAGAPTIAGNTGGGKWDDAFLTVPFALTLQHPDGSGAGNMVRVAKSPETVVPSGLWTGGPLLTPLPVTDATGATITVPDHTAVEGDIVRVGTVDDMTGELSGVWRVASVAGDVLTLEHPVTTLPPSVLAPGGSPGAGVRCQIITPRTVQFPASVAMAVPLDGAADVPGQPLNLSVRVGFAGTGYSVNDIIEVGAATGYFIRVLTIGGGGEVLTFVTEEYILGAGGFTASDYATTGGTGTGLEITVGSVFTGATVAEDVYPSRKSGGVLSVVVSNDVGLMPGKTHVAKRLTGSPTNVSGRNTFQCWVRISVAASPGDLVIYTTDAAGTTVIEQFLFDDIPVANEWFLATFRRDQQWWAGEPPPPTIAAVVVAVSANLAGESIDVDCPIFANYDEPNLGSLISLDDNTSPRYAIDAIDENIVYLASRVIGQYALRDTDLHAYTDVSETANARFTYAVPFPTNAIAWANAPYAVTVEGGWDTVAEERNGTTHFDGCFVGANGVLLGIDSPEMTIKHFGVWRFVTGVRHDLTTIGTNFATTLEECWFGYCGTGLEIKNTGGWVVRNVRGLCSNVVGIQFENAHGCEAENISAQNNVTAIAFDPSCENNRVAALSAFRNTTAVWMAGNGNEVVDANVDECGVGIRVRSPGVNVLRSALFALNGTDIWTWSLVPFAQTRLKSLDHNLLNVDRHYEYGAIVERAATSRPGGAGNMWVISLPRLDIPPVDWSRPVESPVELRLGLIGIRANVQVRAESMMRRPYPEHARGALVIKASPEVGLNADVEVALSESPDWQAVVATFVPTSAGVVEIVARAWRTNATGTTGAIAVDTLRVTQN